MFYLSGFANGEMKKAKVLNGEAMKHLLALVDLT